MTLLSDFFVYKTGYWLRIFCIFKNEEVVSGNGENLDEVEKRDWSPFWGAAVVAQWQSNRLVTERSWAWIPPGAGLFFSSHNYPIWSVSFIRSLVEMKHYWLSYIKTYMLSCAACSKTSLISTVRAKKSILREGVVVAQVVEYSTANLKVKSSYPSQFDFCRRQCFGLE